MSLPARVVLTLALTFFTACSSSEGDSGEADVGEDTSTGDATGCSTVPPDGGAEDGNPETSPVDASPDMAGEADSATTTEAGNALDGDVEADTVAVVPVDINLAATKKNLDDATLSPATFSAPIVITGGVAPFTVSLSPGALPPGLVLADNPGPAPRIKGAWDASAAGADAATFGLPVADSSGLVSAVRSFSVALPPLAEASPSAAPRRACVMA